MTKQEQIDERMLKERLNRIYGVKRSGKLPKTLDMQYAQEVINEYLKQQFKEDNNELIKEVQNEQKD